MRALQETNPEDFSAIEDIVKLYISWVLENQAETSPHGLDIRVEPKFNITTREVYEGQWCRPQNDGPGLRAMTLMIAADHLIQHGQSEYVKEHLWTNDPNAYHGGAIKYDLDYIVDGYDDETCDLWEEVTSSDFFWNRITMRRALIHGAKLATKMGDSAAAATYTSRAQTLNSTLYETHFVGGFLRESETRTMDGAVIIGLNDGYIEGEAQFSPSGYEVAATVAAYNVMFCKEYDINQQDTANGLPGVLYGRYQGDVYMGGNAWIMSTAALASVFYRAAKEIRTSGVPSQAAMAKWSTAFNQPLNNLPTDSYGLSDFFLAQGDGVLLRLRSHVVGKGFHLDEQLDRNTGYELSAKDLTWSYSEVFNAMHHRQQLF
jgi:glucoamylase